MTRKRLRYSELSAAPVAPAVAQPVAPPSAPGTPAVDSGPMAAEMDVAMAGAIHGASPPDPGQSSTGAPPGASALIDARSGVPSVARGGDETSPRPRRNSTPVELARTLTAERAAVIALDGGSAAPPTEGPPAWMEVRAPEPPRSLRERARRRDGTATVLMFRVGGERFAVELVQVEEVIDLPVIHHVPEMPPAMLGVVTVRGSLTPVYSPRQALGLPLALRDAVLIFRQGTQRVGILIDDVDDAVSLDMSELRETAGGEDAHSVLLGVVRLANVLIGLVDVDALIASCQSADLLEIA